MPLRWLYILLILWSGANFASFLLAVLVFLILMQMIDDLHGWD
ncbi:E10 protein [Bos taurus papillomavirus 28]|nr:E10 protein [Bos taurus papillomavirus 28]BBU60026.1 E10 protein [Bos taurus papillomavirus 28]